MTTLQEIASAYIATKAEIKKIDEKIERLKKKREKLSDFFWVDALIKPIAEKLLKKLPGRHYEILGPFGLSAEVSIHFYKNGTPERERFTGNNCVSITFRPCDLDKGELAVVDHDTDTKRFALGTIGEMNGLNHPEIAIEPDADVMELMKWVK